MGMPAMNAPAATAAPRIWICAPGQDVPEWIVERMTSDTAADGSFEIEAFDGPTRVERGLAVFEVEGAVVACQPRQVQEKMALIRGEGAPSARKSVKADGKDQPEVCDQRKKVGVDKPLKLKPVVGVPAAPQFVAVDQLQVDDTYQRSIEGGASRKLIAKIAENWDWRLCLPLLVSRRKGELFVIDGQHRKEAAELRGDIPHLPVVVFDFDDPKAEADLFIQANRSRRQMGKLDDFHAAVVAGDKKALEVNDVVVSAGLSVARIPAWQYWKPGEVVFVSTIQRLLNSQGREPVARALAAIASAFAGSILVGAGAIFEGLVTFSQQRVKAGEPVNDELMAVVLAEVGLPGWKEAVEGADSASDRAEAMLRAIGEAYQEAEAE